MKAVATFRPKLPGWAKLPSPLVSWLREPGSLTRRAQRQFDHFAIRPVFQGAAHGLAPIATSSRTFRTVREVVLEGNGQPFIFAHSVLTGASRGQLSSWLRGLGSRSLGSLLFTHPGFRRGALSFARLDPRSPLYRACLAKLPAGSVIGPRVHRKCPGLWARCCEHRFGPQSIWVIEVFLLEYSDA